MQKLPLQSACSSLFNSFFTPIDQVIAFYTSAYSYVCESRTYFYTIFLKQKLLRVFNVSAISKSVLRLSYCIICYFEFKSSTCRNSDKLILHTKINHVCHSLFNLFMYSTEISFANWFVCNISYV